MQTKTDNLHSENNLSLVLETSSVTQEKASYWALGEYQRRSFDLTLFVRALLEGNQIPFEIRGEGKRKQVVRTRRVADARNLSSYFGKCQNLMDLYSPEEAYRPDFQLFFDCYRNHMFGRLGLGSSSTQRLSNGMLAAEMFNDFVCYLREQAVERKVAKALWALKKEGVDYQEGIVDRWFSGASALDRKMLPFRAELLFPECAAVESEMVPHLCWRLIDGRWAQMPSMDRLGDGNAEHHCRIDVRAAMEARDRFFDNQRGVDADLFDVLGPHLCKVEVGGRHGALHLHVAFLIDVARLPGLPWLQDRFSARWARVTGGRGYVFFPHERQDRGELEAQGKWVLDVLHPRDVERWEKLKQYVSGYFASDDQLLFAKPTERSRTLTAGRTWR
ncbi:hypothetical protein Q2T91_16505 [Ralstonia pseudosolanacearum]|uniref:hypothetical protein n=1 Tax=Ralstonia pseudosolanacearum TaxID=1310165 RepID=UPI001FF85779|nr:hypothetical protein [Ralstonia pseudosolanacearum]